MDVSVVVLSYNTRDLLRRCLEYAVAGSPGSGTEIIVVDNASGDGSPDMVASEFPDVRLIRSGRNAGYAAGNNLGIRAAAGRYVLLLNSDAFLGADTLRQIVAFMEQRPRVGIVGPLLHHEDGALHLSCRHFPTLRRRLAWTAGLGRFLPFRWAREHDWMSGFPHDREMAVDMVSGACWMLRRSMLNEIGLLNEALFLYGEEFDLCCRAAMAGWETWFVPTDPVVHLGGRSGPADDGASVVSSFHRYRSDYLDLRWHRGLLVAGIAAGADQVMLRARLVKSVLLRRGKPGYREALAKAVDNAARAAWEMIRWKHD